MRSAIVHRQVKRALPYSIETIGSKDDYAKWKAYESIRLQQLALEADAKAAIKQDKAVKAFLSTPADVEPTCTQPSTQKSRNKVITKIKDLAATMWRNAFDSERN